VLGLVPGLKQSAAAAMLRTPTSERSGHSSPQKETTIVTQTHSRLARASLLTVRSSSSSRPGQRWFPTCNSARTATIDPGADTALITLDLDGARTHL
jgi:hypothetical protein